MKKTSSSIKQITLGLATAAAAIGLSGCDSKRENAADKKADRMEDRADKVRDAGEKKADATRNAAEHRADAIEKQADAVRDQSPSPSP